MIVDCKRKVILLSTPRGEKLEHKERNPKKAISIISTMQAFRMIRKGCQGYLYALEVTTPVEPNLGEIPIANEFFDIYKDVTGLPPDQEVKFTIGLVSSITPISKALYCIALVELAELGVQLQELVDK